MVTAADYPFLDVLGTMLIFFAWVIWFWLLIRVFGDVFRRHDLSGWGKAGWTLLVIVLPFLGVLIYLIANGQEMGKRDVDVARASRATVRSAHQNGRRLRRRRSRIGDREGQEPARQWGDHAGRIRIAQR